ncbi:MAG: transposase, partial [Elusimicrobia bacterium]|nr:transposase [Elusimicrobiota bacterium]
MSNHYHILVETPYGNLSRGMRHLNGVYTQKYNSINKHIGHVFQGRYKALLVEKESYLSEVARYILLNPVKAKIVRKASEWIWSSYKYTVGIKETPGWLNTDELLGRFGVDKKMAINNFKEFIAEDVKDNLLDQVKGQIYLGRDKFIKKLSGKEIRKEIPIKQQRLRQKPLQVILRKGGNIEEVYSAYAENGYKMREIAEYLKVHYATVSRRIKKYEK